MTSAHHPWHPTRRRLTETLLAALVPVAACSVALAGLTVWVSAGKAGAPPRVGVSDARVFLPYGDTTDTAAFFDISNSGGADDRLVRVTSTDVRGEITLSRHRMTGSGAAYAEDVESAAVPAGGELSMSPQSIDATLRAGADWRTGDLVAFTLHFRHSDPVHVPAVVVRPGS
ncbi:copper chaperone PCu(A)C [Streptomyces sp. GESEQ-4]|uniref:copper chaperone PCu(A)C n=1 Tax=Streptomyces sp. GESEQ-4 TaxID=2812655 RepID=UPI001B32F6BC|nr:copper chaperone PCu(A)C [Streptomyces sp. GESEQ-4]